MIEVSERDDFFMERAFQLAKLNSGKTAPNPWVGAVIVKNGKIIGEGFHKGAGFPHAEVEAIKDARQKGFSTKGAKMYVSLQPCNTYGRTPPCTLEIKKAGIKEVIFSVEDPNLTNWEMKDVVVRRGILKEKGEKILLPYLVYVKEKRPYVILKIAQTLDGKISDFKGRSKYITSEQSLEEVHKLRAKANFIIIGRKTLEEDKPSLNVRFYPSQSTRKYESQTKDSEEDREAFYKLKAEIGGDYPSPVKIVIDPKFTALKKIKEYLERKAKLRKGEGERNIIESNENLWRRWKILHGNNVIFAGFENQKNLEENDLLELQSLGIKNLSFLRFQDEEGIIDGILSFIKDMGGIVVLVEGGGETAWEFLKSDKVDEIHIFIAPLIFGGGKSIGGKKPRPIYSPIKTKILHFEMKGKDILLKCSKREMLWEI